MYFWTITTVVEVDFCKMDIQYAGFVDNNCFNNQTGIFCCVHYVHNYNYNWNDRCTIYLWTIGHSVSMG